MGLSYYPIIDERESCNRFHLQIEDLKVNNSTLIAKTIESADIILVGGGDGFMLDNIKKYQHLNKPLLGVNCGTLGFLMNQVKNISELPSSIEQLDILEESLIQVNAKTNSGEQIDTVAINDIVIGNNLLDYYTISIDGEEISTTIKGTGLLITTAIGSTAYWTSLGGPLLPLSSNLWGIMGIASLPFRYKIINPQEININVSGKFPALAGIDGIGGKIENVKNIKISLGNKIAKLAFLKSENFEHKRFHIISSKLA